MATKFVFLNIYKGSRYLLMNHSKLLLLFSLCYYESLLMYKKSKVHRMAPKKVYIINFMYDFSETVLRNK